MKLFYLLKNLRYFFKRLLFLTTVLLLINIAAKAQTDPVSNVDIQYIPVAPANGSFDTLVKVFVRVQFSDTVPVQRLLVRAGNASGGSNMLNANHNFKGAGTSLSQQTSSNAPIQKVGKNAFVYVGTFLYQNLYYDVRVQYPNSSFSPYHSIYENH